MLFRTTSNYYLYSRNLNKILLLHPILYHIISYFDSSKTASHSLQKILKLKRLASFKVKDIKYYYQKYNFLNENGFIGNQNSYYYIPRRFTGDYIRNLLCNNKNVTFEVTDSCNLRCYYCGYGDIYNNYDKRNNKSLELKKAKMLLNYLKAFWNSDNNTSFNREITIYFYGGEPLLQFNFIKEIVKFVKDIKLKYNYFSFGITTNGILLDKYIDFLVDNNFYTLISLDGDKKNNKYRLFSDGSDSYDKVYENIKMVKKKYPKYFHKNVNFNAVLHKLNTYGNIYRYYKKNFNKKPYISELDPVGIKRSHKRQYLKIFKNKEISINKSKIKDEIDNIMFRKTPDGYKINHLLRFYSNDTFKTCKDLFVSRGEKKYAYPGTCIPLNFNLYLSVNGKIFPCEKVGSQHNLGYISNSMVTLDFSKIARKYNDLFEKFFEQCRICYNVQGCPNCVLLNEENKGAFKCKYFFNRTKFRKYLSKTVGYLEENPHIFQKFLR
jgi:uncharacterized protein